MNFCTVAVYNLMMSILEDNPGPKNIKGDNFLCETRGILCYILTDVVEFSIFIVKEKQIKQFLRPRV